MTAAFLRCCLLPGVPARLRRGVEVDTFWRGKPMTRSALWLCFVTLALAAPTASWAGGAWVPPPGDGDIDFGFSDKTASTSWDTHGHAYTNRNGLGEISYHDLRYFYLAGEIGLFKNFSATFLMPSTDAIEG